MIYAASSPAATAGTRATPERRRIDDDAVRPHTSRRGRTPNTVANRPITSHDPNGLWLRARATTGQGQIARSAEGLPAVQRLDECPSHPEHDAGMPVGPSVDAVAAVEVDVQARAVDGFPHGVQAVLQRGVSRKVATTDDDVGTARSSEFADRGAEWAFRARLVSDPRWPERTGVLLHL